MSAYVVYDVQIHDAKRYLDYTSQVKPEIEAVGGRYLARGGECKVIEGSWVPSRLVLFEFPSMAKAEEFYNSETYQRLKPIRDESSTGSVVIVEGYTEGNQSS